MPNKFTHGENVPLFNVKHHDVEKGGRGINPDKVH